MQAHLEGNLKLGSDTVDARYQHWIDVFGLVHGKKTAKASNFAEHAARKSFVGQVLDALLGAVGAVNIYASVGVGDRCGGGGVLGHGFWRSLSSSSCGKDAGFLAKQELPRSLIVTRSKRG